MLKLQKCRDFRVKILVTPIEPCKYVANLLKMFGKLKKTLKILKLVYLRNLLVFFEDLIEAPSGKVRRLAL